jgi:hypothetical protein
MSISNKWNICCNAVLGLIYPHMDNMIIYTPGQGVVVVVVVVKIDEKSATERFDCK